MVAWLAAQGPGHHHAPAFRDRRRHGHLLQCSHDRDPGGPRDQKHRPGGATMAGGISAVLHGHLHRGVDFEVHRRVDGLLFVEQCALPLEHVRCLRCARSTRRGSVRGGHVLAGTERVRSPHLADRQTIAHLPGVEGHALLRGVAHHDSGHHELDEVVGVVSSTYVHLDLHLRSVYFGVGQRHSGRRAEHRRRHVHKSHPALEMLRLHDVDNIHPLRIDHGRAELGLDN
mmetsp:Transcript_69399/g.201082  ORF Transcript_69399/g.201082 Transcript_69399/m.201082 type:complete len:229 (+) Transcript_69399:613-1299(+)